MPCARVIARCGRSGSWGYCHLYEEGRKLAPPPWSCWPKCEIGDSVAGAFVDSIEVCARYDQLEASLAVPTPDDPVKVDVITSMGYLTD